MAYAILKNQRVVKIIETDEISAQQTINDGIGSAYTEIIGNCVIGQKYVDGVFIDIVDTGEPTALESLKQALAYKIGKLNEAYPTLNLNIDDDIITAIPKLFNAGVLEGEASFLNTLYQAIKLAE